MTPFGLYNEMVKAYEHEWQEPVPDHIKDRAFYTWRKWARHNGFVEQCEENRRQYMISDVQLAEQFLEHWERGIVEYGPQYLPPFTGVFKLNGDPQTAPADKIIHRGKAVVKKKPKGYDW